MKQRKKPYVCVDEDLEGFLGRGGRTDTRKWGGEDGDGVI